MENVAPQYVARAFGVAADTTVQHNLDDTLDDNDKTQPIEEHLNALEDLRQDSQKTDSDVLDPGPSSQASAPPSTPPTQLSILQERVQQRPSDSNAWLELLSFVKGLEEYDKIVETYEAMIGAFPNMVSPITHFALEHISS